MAYHPTGFIAQYVFYVSFDILYDKYSSVPFGFDMSLCDGHAPIDMVEYHLISFFSRAAFPNDISDKARHNSSHMNDLKDNAGGHKIRLTRFRSPAKWKYPYL